MNTTWYHATPTIISGALRGNDQGIHLAKTKAGAVSVLLNRGLTHGQVYEITLNENALRPLLINFDPMDWSPISVAEILLSIYNDSVVSGAYGEVDDEGSQWKDDLPISQITDAKFDFDSSDIAFLNNILQGPKRQDFVKLGKFLESFGYNCIVYPLAEDELRSQAIMIWDPELIKSKDFVEVWDGEDV